MSPDLERVKRLRAAHEARIARYGACDGSCFADAFDPRDPYDPDPLDVVPWQDHDELEDPLAAPRGLTVGCLLGLLVVAAAAIAWRAWA